MVTDELDELEYPSIRKLYEAVADTNSVSYRSFLETLQRLREGNERTKRRVQRTVSGAYVRGSHRISSAEAPFLTFDGEGWDDKYVLLANSSGDYVVNPNGLTTLECLEFLTRPSDGMVKRVWFSFSYDVNHILADLPDEDINTIFRGKSVQYDKYRISYYPGKILVINGFKFYDCFGFFAKSFLKVVEHMLGPEALTPSLIEGKAGRGSFEEWDLDKIVAYNREELALLVRILDKLRIAFADIGVYLTEWYGPGAVAKVWFKQHDVVPKEQHTPGAVTALNDAYYGGRFEQISLGKIDPIYEYDIHSAYPSVMVDMPYFRSWRKVSKFVDNQYSVWHLSFDLRPEPLPTSVMFGGSKIKLPDQDEPIPSFMPLPVRAKDGHISFPLVGKGWYWYSEVKVMLDYFPKAKVTFHEGYVARVEGKPFAWIADMYEQRKVLKAEGNLAEYAIKVGLNSLYGKCAQRVGSSQYFSLAWAGYITSTTRAKLARAGYERPRGRGTHEVTGSHIIGFATDALFSTIKLPHLETADVLGAWERTDFSSGLFVQSGVYQLTRADGTVVTRYRGSSSRRGFDDIVTQLERRPSKHPKVKHGLFVSRMLAMASPRKYGPLAYQFIRIDFTLNLDAAVKRHYTDFTVKFDPVAMTRQQDYSRLLRRRINSEPMVTADDTDWRLTAARRYGKWPIGNIESCASPMKDSNTIRMMKDAQLLTEESRLNRAIPVETVSIVEVDDME
jgi:hypothetical protein